MGRRVAIISNVLPGVEPLVVLLDADPDLFDVLLRPGQVAVQVGEVGIRDRDRVPDLRRSLPQLGEFAGFRQGAPPMAEPAKLGVQVGYFKQPQLRLGRCLHEGQL